MLGLGVILIIIGSFSRYTDFSMAGSIFLFVLGLVVMFGGLTYATGEETYYVYGDNFTGYHWDYDYTPSPNPNADDGIFLFHTVTTIEYTAFDSELVEGIDIDHVIGFLISMLGALTFILSLFEVKRLPEIHKPRY